jgi:hypothetical protein
LKRSAVPAASATMSSAMLSARAETIEREVV